MPSKSLNIFCDESHPVKNDGADFFIIGCSIIEEDILSEVVGHINVLKHKYGYDEDYEIKWYKINGKNISLVKDIITYIFNSEVCLRILVVPNKNEKDYKLFLSHEELYISMYYLLLDKIFVINRFTTVDNVNLFIDKRNSNSNKNAEKLAKRIYYHNRNISSYNSCVVDSKKEQLIQVIDLFIGAAAYEKLGLKTSTNKLDVISHIKDKFKLSKLVFRSSMQAEKYNVFIWDGRYGKI